MREFEESHAPRWVKSGLSVGSGALFATGLFVGVVLRNVLLGVLLFALGAILFAIRGYLSTGDKAVPTMSLSLPANSRVLRTGRSAGKQPDEH
jgi:hypothetical protein